MSGKPDTPGLRPIALIGLRGSGKTTVGRILADVIGGKCIDVDEVIQEESKLTISRIFELEGAEGFRRREREAIAKIAVSPPAVVSVGGGAVLDEANAKALSSMAEVVWLTAPAHILWERVSKDPATKGSRPSLTELNGVAEVEELAKQRFECYRRLADVIVDTHGLSPKQVAQAILEKLART